ncbi:MAG TPA: SprT family zinc-dependent metalloprotease [Anaerolineales bacterium]|nr:SprT family zinc-dependent metalloprotease [Anaerolineales bacterium]
MSVTVDRIIRSKRRTLSLIVENNGSITVRAPMRMSEKIIQEFVVKHANWVEKKQAEMRATTPVQPKQYQPGETFLYLGREYALEVVQDQKKKLVLDDRFLLAESVLKNAEQVFQDWYRQQARLIISERIKFFAEKYEFHYDRIRITSARTRWGSCSSKGTLNFSWRLIMTPLDIVDYVVIHELAHTVHHNHSKRFWGLVEKILPDYKDQRKRLKQYGQQVL